MSKQEDRRIVTVYTDGSCLKNGDDKVKAGAAAWFEDDETLNRAVRLPNRIPQNNNTAKMVGARIAIETAP
ncbi:hypothetical protein CYLTODRAFT_474827 [Cylindrobasidium torrendii FP15055 ss-10]|uniref:RNase H type-1 domain-containing protein n=1 Tax=Cylindrobasidium torrendii FP15055 ss-10 TaxID=1314674 RepID=A0A0D7AVB4_9AGAR|nr:hypothetical protein CYLTODRAFT_474827 [Cylindrobasidium torrendii FP15055 ss-10]